MRISRHLQLPEGENQPLVPQQIDTTAAHSELIIPMTMTVPPQGIVESSGLGEMVRQLWRRKYLILSMAACGMLSGVVLALIMPAVYRAQVTMQLEGFHNEGLRGDSATAAMQVPNAPVDHYLQNQLKLLRSEALAKRVGDKLGIKPPQGESGILARLISGAGKVPPTPERRKISIVQRSMEVKPAANSEVIEVFFRSPDPAKAALGANTVAEEFIELNREYRQQRVVATTEWLTKQAEELKAKLEKSSQALHDYATASGLVFSGPDDHSTLAKERMRLIEESLSSARADRAQKQARFDAVRSAPPAIMPDGVAGDGLRRTESELQGLRRQLAEMRTLYTPAHQKVKSLEAQIAELERGISEGRKEAVGRLQTEFEAATRLERETQRLHQSQQATLQGQADRATRYNLLKREVETTQQLYDVMLQREKEAGMMAALRTTNVRVIDKAEPPLAPHEPNLPLNSAVGLALGTVSGIAFALSRKLPELVRRPGDTAELNIPELGAIPSARHDFDRGGVKGWLPNLSGNNGELGLVTWKEGGSLLSESFRATLASVLFCCESSKKARTRGIRLSGQILVVTSTEPTEGKTTVATNLAIALAETNRKVLVIDADMRRPRVHTIFDVPNEWGLSDFLQTDDAAIQGNLESLWQPTSVPNLWVFPSGPGAAVVSKLLYSANLKRLLKQCKEKFDLVLLDTPPMMPYSDARVLGRLSDGVVIVVRANHTGREALKSACMRLMQDRIPVLGTVLNDWVIDNGTHRAYSSYYKPKKG